jgi:hypothetical protein
LQREPARIGHHTRKNILAILICAAITPIHHVQSPVDEWQAI